MQPMTYIVWFGGSVVRSNPPINQTNNGGQRLLAFASVVPPLFVAYFKR